MLGLGPGRKEPDFAPVIPRLRRYARVLTRDGDRADDLVQDTLARAWEKRALWRDGSDLRAWTFAIMHNLFVSQLAARRRESGSVSLDDAEGEIAERAAAGEVPGAAPEALDLQRQVMALPPEQREVLLLVAVEQMRYEEAAETLQIPIGTVMSRLSRARERLRRALDEPSTLRRVK